MKRIIFSLSLLLFMPGMYGHDRAYNTRRMSAKNRMDNYPLVRQYDLVEKTKRI